MAPHCQVTGGGLVFFSPGSEHETLVCLVCKKKAESLAELQLHVESHEDKQSAVCLPIAPSWIRATTRTKSQQILSLEIPFKDFSKAFLKISSPVKVKSIETKNESEEISPDVPLEEGSPDADTGDTDVETSDGGDSIDQGDQTDDQDVKEFSGGSSLVDITPENSDPVVRTSARLKDKPSKSWKPGRRKAKVPETTDLETSQIKEEASSTKKKPQGQKRKISKGAKTCDASTNDGSPVRKRGKRDDEDSTEQGSDDTPSTEKEMCQVKLESTKNTEEISVVEVPEDDVHEGAGCDLRGQKELRKYWIKNITEFQCKDCQWKSPHHYNYHRHLFTHRKNIGQFQCDYCGKPLDAAGGKSGYGQRKSVCPVCGAGPMHQGRLTTHMVSEHNITSSPISGKPILNCQECSYKTSKPSLLLKHLQKHEQGEPEVPETKPRREKKPKALNQTTLICEQCGYTTNRTDLLKSHMLRHNPEAAEELQCDRCDFVTISSKGLAIHQKTHKVGLVQCSECPPDEDGLRTQIPLDVYPAHLLEAHAIATPIYCNICGQVVQSQSQHEEHLSQHHGVTPKVTFYVCHVCGEAMDCKDDLMNHQAIHNSTSIKSEPEPTTSTDTDDCDQSESGNVKGQDANRVQTRNTAHYRTLRQRLNALRNSSHQEAFSCTQCEEHFSSLQQLNTHLYHSHGVTDYKFQCKTCGHFEKNQGRLRKHVAQHHSIREVYVCDLCGFEAARRWNLLRHKETAHKFTTYSCSHCDYSTKSVIRVADHFRKVHLTEPPAEILRMTEESSKDKGAGLHHFVKDKRKAYMKKMMKTKYAPEKKMCSDCGKLVPPGLMEMHMNTHQGLKPYRCHYENCSYSAVASSMISFHIRRKHLGMNSKKYHYQCAYCDFQHQNRKYLERHIATAHPEGDGTAVTVALDEQLYLKQENPGDEALESIVAVGDQISAEEVHIEVSTDAQALNHYEESPEMYMMIAPEMEDSTAAEAVVEQFTYTDSDIINPELLDGSTQHIVVICEDQISATSS